MADYTPSTWAAAVLQKLGYPVTPGGVKALAGWAQAEGGHWNNQAKFNPLNTTQAEPGAGNTGAQGNIKVYKNWDQGIDATVQTLKNGRYSGILSGLRSGDAGAVANAIGQSPWGTSGGLVRQTIAAAPGSVPRVPASPAGGTTTTVTRTTPGVDNSQQRRALVANFLAQGGVKSANAVGALASGYQAAQDVPGATSTTTTASGAAQAARTPSGGGLAAKATARADVVDAHHLPYAWAGGHAGKTDPQQAVPVDCSGAVSEVLGIDPRVSGQFTTWGKPGDGGSRGVTIAANDHHVIMKINGHWFGTSASNPGGGAGWIPQDDISPEYLRGFTLRHA